METIIAGFMSSLTPITILYTSIGVFIGVFVGAIPGISSGIVMTLSIPLTYAMSPVAAIGFLIGVNKGGSYGGALASILLNTPGTGEAVATTFDGYPMSQQGKGMKAIKGALLGSFFGDTVSTFVLIFIAAPIAGFALKMGPSEVCAMILFALTVIAAFESGSISKGLICSALGMLISTIGVDPVVGLPRLTFDVYQLDSGISIMCLAIGALAISEIVIQIENMARNKIKNKDEDVATVVFSTKPEDNALSLVEMRALGKTLVRSSFIGSTIGALPGLGAGLASFLAYGTAKKSSKDPESFGKGNIEGVVAPETANNAVMCSSLIPLFTLGIPGGIAAAILIGAFVLHGIAPGPLMFEQHGETVYGIYGAMVIGNFALLGIGLVGIKFFAKILQTPKVILLPIILYICLVGSYLNDPSTFTVALTICFGILGYFMKKLAYSFASFIVGFVMGPMLELTMQQTLISYGDNFAEILTRPGTVVIVLANLLFIFWQIKSSFQEKVVRDAKQ